MIDIWLTCCRLAGRAYYWQQLRMFGLLMNMLSPCLQRILYKVTVILFDNSMIWLTYDYRVATLLAEHTIDNNSACLILLSCLCSALTKSLPSLLQRPASSSFQCIHDILASRTYTLSHFLRTYLCLLLSVPNCNQTLAPHHSWCLRYVVTISYQLS